MPIPLRTRAEMDQIARAGQVLDAVLHATLAAAVAGRTTADLGQTAADEIARAGAESLLTNYPGKTGPYGQAACVCVNEELVHAPPRGRILRPGDLLTVDCAIRMPPGPQGWCVDAALCKVIDGPDTTRARDLCAAAEACVGAVLALCRCGVRWSTIAAAARDLARSRGCTLAPEYCGHGIGRTLHESPKVGFGNPPEADFTLRPGMVFTIEPIAVEGTGPAEFVTLDDGWTVLTTHRRWSAHRELTLGLTPDGPLVLAGRHDSRVQPPLAPA